MSSIVGALLLHTFALLSLALVSVVLVACPKFDAAPVSAECSKQFAKCKLPDGPLGVCAEVTCKQGETGPCFKCMSQH